ncbi:MAG: DUF5716 family protein [Treponema sp.]|jgi:hypothetical protein|nr:DUF5716 family protein [Treponema sp.]
MPSGPGLFSTLPGNFFSPLVGANREHYGALLVRYYRLFQENARGLEREQVIRSFTEYLALNRTALADEGADDLPLPGEAGDGEAPELDFGSAETGQEGPEGEGAGNPAGAAVKRMADRVLANLFLRRLVHTGWLSEETLGDYSRVINITPHGRPFFEALARVEEGLKTEYESHVVAVYSLLCGDAAEENGHYAVLNAHSSTQTLIDSLKVLSQSIKGHYDRLTADTASSDISGILHLHYDLYAADILDGAYKRLKTSDNLSRYRPKIIKKVGDLLENEAWLNESARKLSRNNSLPQADNRRKLQTMLEDIRDTLRAVDPLLEDIDRRNMLYARSSVERVKALLEPDSTIAGKLGALIRELYRGNPSKGAEDDSGELWHKLAHRLHRVRTFARESLYHRYQREGAGFSREIPPADREAMEREEAELLVRLRRQLGVKRIGEWLDGQGGRERLLFAADLVKDENSFIRFVYSVLYADSRPAFGYSIEDRPPEGDPAGASVRSGGYVVPDVTLRRKE